MIATYFPITMLLSFAYHLLLFTSFLFLSPRFCVSSRVNLGSDVVHQPRQDQGRVHTWQHFNKLLNAKKGSHAHGILDLKKYLHRFGYSTIENPNCTASNRFGAHLEHALTGYQAWHGLPVTGVFDTETLASITTPRCGAPDLKTSTRLHTTMHYVYFEGRPRWARKIPITLTYSFSRERLVDYLTLQDVRNAFRNAFSRWESVIPVIFREIDEYAKADVKIGFYGGDHGDGEPFDGSLGILAHAFSPENGRLHLDEAERWAVDFLSEKSKEAVDLESVALHEIGHILGLGHSMDKGAVMYPSLKPRSKKLELALDDVKGVQALYGSNPNFKIEPFLESETSGSSHRGCGLGGCSWYWTQSVVLFMVYFRLL